MRLAPQVMAFFAQCVLCQGGLCSALHVFSLRLTFRRSPPGCAQSTSSVSHIRTYNAVCSRAALLTSQVRPALTTLFVRSARLTSSIQPALTTVRPARLTPSEPHIQRRLSDSHVKPRSEFACWSVFVLLLLLVRCTTYNQLKSLIQVCLYQLLESILFAKIQYVCEHLHEK